MRRPGELRVCFVFEFRKGKIVSLHGYYDMLTLLDQLGLAPAWGQATE
jgi:ketosteroid isomerase-like protein